MLEYYKRHLVCSRCLYYYQYSEPVWEHDKVKLTGCNAIVDVSLIIIDAFAWLPLVDAFFVNNCQPLETLDTDTEAEIHFDVVPLYSNVPVSVAVHNIFPFLSLQW